MDDLGKQAIIRNNLDLIETVLMVGSDKWSGGTKRFGHVTNSDLDTLHKIGALDETERQNNSPSIKELRRVAVDFEKLPGVRVSFDGYLVSPQRPDARISIDAVRVKIPKDLVTIDLEQRVGAVAKSADEFDRNDDEGVVTYEMWWD